MTHPLTTTLNRIWAQNPCDQGKACALAAAGKSVPDDEPITFAQIVEAVGLEDALWCCRAEPQHSREWRLFAVWCARQVQHLMTDPRSVKALDVAEKYAAGEATDEQLDAARDAARVSVDDARWSAARAVAEVAALAVAPDWAAASAAAAAASTAVVAAAWAAAGNAAVCPAKAAQRDAFLQLVTTGTLPAVGQEVAA